MKNEKTILKPAPDKYLPSMDEDKTELYLNSGWESRPEKNRTDNFAPEL